MPPIAEARDLFAVYPSPTGGVAALRGLTLSIEEGEICVVLGPSGSGKTTLMRVLAGLERPSAGTMHVAGLDVGHAPARQVASHRSRVLGYADQHYWRALAGELTAEELVAVPLGLLAIPPAQRRVRAHELLERVGLADRAGARPHELSGGEQQRVALCAAVAHRPRLLIADEPTGELDAETADEVYDLLEELAREHGAAAVLVSHDPASSRIADRVVHLRDGRISEEQQEGEQAVVIGEGGWLRVPEELLHAAGIGGRALVRSRDRVVELHPVAGSDGRRPDASAPQVSGARGGLLEARRVSRSFGTQIALRGVDAQFRPGELTVVTGPSGSGKSTLLGLLSGLDVPDRGEVVLDGVTLSALDREGRAAFRRERISVVLQDLRLAGFLSASETVELGLAARGVVPEEARVRARDALASVELAEHADRPVESLSAGQRERVVLARAFAARPSVVVADEPTARLDAATTLTVGELLASLARRTETTVVCATHDPLLVGLADREVRLRASSALASTR